MARGGLGRFALGFTAGASASFARDIKEQGIALREAALERLRFKREDEARQGAAALKHTQGVDAATLADERLTSRSGREIVSLHEQLAGEEPGTRTALSLRARINKLTGAGGKFTENIEGPGGALGRTDAQGRFAPYTADGETFTKPEPKQARLIGLVHPTLKDDDGKPKQAVAFASDRDKLSRLEGEGYVLPRAGQTININDRTKAKALAEVEVELRKKRVEVRSLLQGLDRVAKQVNEGGADVLSLSGSMSRFFATIKRQGVSIISKGGRRFLRRVPGGAGRTVPNSGARQHRARLG